MMIFNEFTVSNIYNLRMLGFNIYGTSHTLVNNYIILNYLYIYSITPNKIHNDVAYYWVM